MEQSSRKQRLPAIVVAIGAILVAFTAIQVVSRIAYSDRGNAIYRILDMDSAGWVGVTWDGDSGRVMFMGRDRNPKHGWRLAVMQILEQGVPL